MKNSAVVGREGKAAALRECEWDVGASGVPLHVDVQMR